MAVKKTVTEVKEAAVAAVEHEVSKQVNIELELQNAEKRRRKLLDYYKAEERVPVYVSPMYRPYFGNVMQVMINGISISFKVDGTTQRVPKSFADEIEARRCAIDEILKKQEKMANDQENVETSPGEIALF